MNGFAKIVPLAAPALTNQQLADFALTEWQEARRAALRGDRASMEIHKREAFDLLARLERV